MKPFLAFLLSAALLAAQEPIRGFPKDQWAAEHDLEQKAIALPQADRQKVYLERMAQVPHHAGSPASAAVAEYALGLFKEFGLDARIEHFEALIPYPTARALEMVVPLNFGLRSKSPPFRATPIPPTRLSSPPTTPIPGRVM